MKMSHNTLIATACVCATVIGCVSVLTGHDGLDLCLATIAGLSGVAAPVAGKWIAAAIPPTVDPSP